MAGKSWKLEKDLCRCCLSEGSFKNLAEPYSNLGEEEIYSEMLIESLDINLTPVAGPLCASTYTICGECILRLRDACSFKRQVILSEKRFLDLYRRDVFQLQSSNVGVKLEAPDSDNEGVVKVEIEQNDDEDFTLTYDHDDDDNKSSIELEMPAAKKPKTRKTKAKEKAKPTAAQKKKAGRPRKVKAEAEGDAEAESAAGGARKEKKGVDEKQNERQCTVVEHEGVTQFMCNLCKRTYMRRELFMQHYKHVHLKQRPKLRSCYLCEVKVPGYMRTRHLEEAHGVPRPQCNACGKKFAFPFQVISHQKRFHMDEKLFPCPKCDLKFTIPSKLAQHSLKHSSLRPHKCEYCEKAFKWKKNLTTHIMMHLNDRRHVCSVCNEAFVQQTSLKYHLARKHPEVT